jgi:mono/diheme cytochrome c family protein
VSCAHPSSRAISCDYAPVATAPAGTLKLANRFATDAAFRRDCLDKSLVNKNNGYSKVRLAHYDDWGKLAVAAFKTRPVVPDDLGKPVPTPDTTWVSVPIGTFPDTEPGLTKRGEQMFLRYPAQLERSLIAVLRDPQGPSRYGLWQTRDSVGGLVWVTLPGGVFPSLTCSSCHASVDGNGVLLAGVPNHRFDVGRARDDYVNARSFLSTWGPGRVDLTADDKDHPIVIADVRAVRFEAFLHRTANIKNSLTALALRVETGLIAAHFNKARPERKDAFALSYYLWTLGERFNLDAPLRHPGRALFVQHCASCHQGQSHAGPPVPPQAIQSPVAEMSGVARGTGKVQTISLLGLSSRRRLLYGGEALSIDQFLDPSRAAGGHYVGASLNAAERQAIKAYLERL